MDAATAIGAAWRKVQSAVAGREMRLMGCVSGAGADAEGREAKKVNKQIDEQLAKDKQVSRSESCPAPEPYLFIY